MENWIFVLYYLLKIHVTFSFQWLVFVELTASRTPPVGRSRNRRRKQWKRDRGGWTFTNALSTSHCMKYITKNVSAIREWFVGQLLRKVMEERRLSNIHCHLSDTISSLSFKSSWLGWLLTINCFKNKMWAIYFTW